MQLYKKGVSTNLITKIIGGVIGLVVLFLVGAQLIPEAQTAGTTLCDSGVPLGSLFGGSGVVFIIVMASIFLAVFAAFFLRSRR